MVCNIYLIQENKQKRIIIQMQKLIKLQPPTSNIIKKSLFVNLSSQLLSSAFTNSFKLCNFHSKQPHLNHNQNSPRFSFQIKHHFSTKRSNFDNTSDQQAQQMQPEIKITSLLKASQYQQSETQKQVKEPHAQDDPFATYDQELFDELAKSEQTSPQTQNHNHKLRSQKRKEKLQKIRSQLKDPQYRRQRNRQRHRKEKQKLQKTLTTLKQEEIKTYLISRKKQRLEMKQKVKQAVQKQIGQPFLIDIAFQHQMNQKQNKSLAIQIELIVKTLKQIDPPPNVHLCGLKEGITKNQLISNRFEVWPIKSYSHPLQECLSMQKFKDKKFYYLSPDASKTLDTIEPDSVFIIGGLVDRTVIKNASLNRARKLNIEARSLPIRPFMKQRSCLNLDHIVMIMCKFMQVKDWKVAFDYGAPKRWKCGEGEKGLKQLQPEPEDLSD